MGRTACAALTQPTPTAAPSPLPLYRGWWPTHRRLPTQGLAVASRIATSRILLPTNTSVPVASLRQRNNDDPETMQETQATPAAAASMLAARWLTLIERDFIEISEPYNDARTTRLVDTLRFWSGGKLFATLDARPGGLLFTDCSEGLREHAGLNLVQAQELIGLSLQRAMEAGVRLPPASRPASPDRYGQVIPLSPDASAR
jgi:hypothetical protein